MNKPSSSEHGIGKTKFGDVTPAVSCAGVNAPEVRSNAKTHTVELFWLPTTRYLPPHVQLKFRGHAPPLGVMPTSSIAPVWRTAKIATES